MRRNILFLVSIPLIISCSEDREVFRVSGTLENGGGGMVYLKKMTSAEMITADSCLIDTSGYFELRDQARILTFYGLYTEPENWVYLLAENGDDIILNGDALRLPYTYEIEGSEHSKLIRELIRAQNSTLAAIEALSRIFNDSLRSPDFMNIKSRLDSSYTEIVDAQREFTFGFIERNLHSLASLMALYQQIGSRHYLLDPDEDFRFFAMVDSSLSILYPESDAVKDLNRQVEELQQKKQFERISATRLEKGMMAPEIALPGPDGDTILLSSTRGKIVLLDFWAAWCSPCREENPNLVKAYRKYKDRGFEIFQVSLDQTREAWLRGIREDQLYWIHVSDLQFWNSIVVPIYNIQGIPMSYLLDREGRIIDYNLRGPALEARLDEILNP